MKKILLFVSIAIIFASCSSKSNFSLEVNIHNNNSLIDKQLVIVQSLDGNTVYTDTVKIKKNNFALHIPYEGPALVNISILKSNIKDLLLAAEDGIVQLNIEGEKAFIGGTLLNDRLQAFYSESDSISSLFRELDRGIMQQDTPQAYEEYRQKRSSLIKENTDRIIAFIKENIDNPVGEYYYMTNYIMYPPERQSEMRSFATEKLKK